MQPVQHRAERLRQLGLEPCPPQRPLILHPFVVVEFLTQKSMKAGAPALKPGAVRDIIQEIEKETGHRVSPYRIRRELMNMGAVFSR